MRTTSVPSATDTPPSFSKRLASAILLLNLCVYALAAFSLFQSWRQYETRVKTSTQNLAETLEYNIVGIMGKSTVALLAVVDEAERSLAAGGIDEQPFNDFVLRQTDRVPELDRIRVTDSQGDIRYGDNIDPAALVNLADRDYFQYALENPQAGVYISKPYVGRVTNRWVFNLSHRINYPDGSFAGIVFGVFPIEFFTTLFSTLDIGRNGIIDLRYDDLSVVARYPEPNGFGSTIGSVDTLSAFIDLAQAGNPGATFAGRSRIDDVYRIFTYRKLPALPFYIRVGQSRGALFADFARDFSPLAVLILFFTLVTIWFARQMVRTWRSEEQAAADLRTANQELEMRVAERTAALQYSEQQLKSYIEHAGDAIYVVAQESGRIISCNQKACQDLGYSQQELIQLSASDIEARHNPLEIEAIHRVLDELPRLQIESVHRRKDGTSFPVEITLSRLDFAEPPSMLSIARDVTERKQTEAALRASEMRYRALFENSDDGILLTVPDGGILSANPAACLMFGRTEAEIRAGGRNLLVDVSDPRLAAAMEERERTGRVRTELTFLRRDGSRFPGEMTSVLFFGENGETRTSMTIRDITARVSLQEELRISLEKYRILFESFPLGIAVTSDTGAILEVNQAAERLLALPRDLFVGRIAGGPEWRVVQLDGTPMPSDELASMRALREQRLIENVEMGIVTGPDAVSWLSVTAAPIPLSGYGVAITYSDIGDRVRAEEALRESEHTLRVLIDATLDSILLLETDGTVVIGNATVAARLHSTPAALPGSNAFDLLPPAVAEFRRQQMQTVLNTGKPVHFEDERFGRWFDNSIYPVYSTQGKITRAAMFDRDITERKQAEKELRKSEASYRALARNFPDGAVLLFDREMRYLIADGASLRQAGFAPGSMVGRTLAEVRAGSPNLAHLTELYQTILDGKSVQEEMISGDRIYVLTGVPVVDEKDGVYAGMIMTQDITERKRAEEELRASERRLATLLSNLPGMAYRCQNNHDWRMEFVSAGCTELTGYRPEDLVNNRLIAYNDLIHPDDQTQVWEQVQQALAERRPFTLNYRIITASGEEKVVLERGRAIFAEEDDLLALEGLMLDVTAQVRAETALRQSEERFRAIFDSAAIGIALMGESGRPLLVNPAMQRFMGRSTAQLQQSSTEELTHPDDLDADRRLLAELLAGQRESYSLEKRYLRPDGQIRWGNLTVSAIYDATGVITSAISMVEDITERKQAAERLRTSEERLSLAMQAGNLGLYDLNIQTGQAIVNTEYARMLGYDPAEFHETNAAWNERLHPDDQEQAGQIYRDYVAGRIPEYRLEFRQRTQAGDWKWILSAGRLVERDAAGEPLRMLGVHIDITDRVQAEAALREAKQAAEAASRAKSEFLANMSHELRTPLNAILGFSELMARDSALSPIYQENLAIIKRSGEYLLGLINDVLDMAKIEAGRVTLQERSFDLRHMIRDLMMLFQMRAKAKGLTLSVLVDPRVPEWMQTDESKLRQVLINLVSNAVKFTAAGSVVLSVHLAESEDGPRLFFAVRDTGPGIAADDLTRIFEPFVQSASGHAAQEGTGLGLPISRRFVQMMGGELTVASSGVPGEGSLFQFAVPFVPVVTEGMAALLPAANDPEPAIGEKLAPVFDLTGVSFRWIKQVRRAAAEADTVRLSHLAAEIKGVQPALSLALHNWIDDYNYTAILAAVQVTAV